MAKKLTIEELAAREASGVRLSKAHRQRLAQSAGPYRKKGQEIIGNRGSGSPNFTLGRGPAGGVVVPAGPVIPDSRYGLGAGQVPNPTTSIPGAGTVDPARNFGFGSAGAQAPAVVPAGAVGPAAEPVRRVSGTVIPAGTSVVPAGNVEKIVNPSRGGFTVNETMGSGSPGGAPKPDPNEPFRAQAAKATAQAQAAQTAKDLADQRTLDAAARANQPTSMQNAMSKAKGVWGKLNAPVDKAALKSGAAKFANVAGKGLGAVGAVGGLHKAATAEGDMGEFIGGGLQTAGSLALMTKNPWAMGLGALALGAGSMMGGKGKDNQPMNVDMNEVNAMRAAQGRAPLSAPGVLAKKPEEAAPAAAAAAPAEHPMMAIYREALAKMNQGPILDNRGSQNHGPLDNPLNNSRQTHENLRALRRHQTEQAMLADRILGHANQTAATDASTATARTRLAADLADKSYERGVAGTPKNFTTDADGKVIPNQTLDQMSLHRAQMADPSVFGAMHGDQQARALGVNRMREQATQAFDARDGAASPTYVETRNAGPTSLRRALLDRNAESVGDVMRATFTGTPDAVVEDQRGRRRLAHEVAGGDRNLRAALEQGKLNTPGSYLR